MDRAPDPPNTPGWVGYVIAVVTAILLYAAVMAVLLLPGLDAGSSTLSEYVTLTWVSAFYVALGAVPIALLVVPTTHLLCHGVHAQWMHLLVIGSVTFMLTSACFLLLTPPGAGLPAELWGFGLLAGVAATVGRALVIPLVWLRRKERVDGRIWTRVLAGALVIGAVALIGAVLAAPRDAEDDGEDVAEQEEAQYATVSPTLESACDGIDEHAAKSTQRTARADKSTLFDQILTTDDDVRGIGVSRCGATWVVLVGVSDSDVRLPVQGPRGTPVAAYVQPPIVAY